jgi:uncharacterized protein YdhG (YjbR/CyaY superfamily)
MKKHETVEAYLADVPAAERTVLQKIRAAVRSVVPDAGEKISYGMPAFTYHGNLLFYAAMKHHLSLFPGSKSVVKQFAEELAPFDAAEGTIRFTVEKPLPMVLVKKIAKARAAENRARANARKR